MLGLFLVKMTPPTVWARSDAGRDDNKVHSITQQFHPYLQSPLSHRKAAAFPTGFAATGRWRTALSLPDDAGKPGCPGSPCHQLRLPAPGLTEACCGSSLNGCAGAPDVPGRGRGHGNWSPRPAEPSRRVWPLLRHDRPDLSLLLLPGS